MFANTGILTAPYRWPGLPGSRGFGRLRARYLLGLVEDCIGRLLRKVGAAGHLRGETKMGKVA